MNQLIEKLNSKNEFDVSHLFEDSSVIERTKFKYDEILRNKIPTHPGSLYSDIKIGVITEMAIAEIIGGKLNPSSKHDYTDWTTYAYDVLGPSQELIEVKRISRNDRYIRFNMKGCRPYPPKATYLDTFFKNCHRLDNLILVDVDFSKGILIPKYIIDAKTFKKYVGLAEASYAPTHWYNNNWAIKSGHCFKFF